MLFFGSSLIGQTSDPQPIPQDTPIEPGGMVEMALQLGGVIRWVSDASEPAEGEEGSHNANRKSE